MYISLYSLANGPLMIVVNLTVTPFFMRIWDLLRFVCMYVCFKLAKIHSLLTCLYGYL